jgi:hypothetical protein
MKAIYSSETPENLRHTKRQHKLEDSNFLKSVNVERWSALLISVDTNGHEQTVEIKKCKTIIVG